MDDIFFHFTLKAATSRWSRMEFWRMWRRMAGNDRRRVPPYFPALNTLLTPQANYLPFTLEALHRRRTDLVMQPGAITPQFIATTPTPVATAILLPIPDQTRAAHFSLFLCANNEAVVDHFFDTVAEETNVRHFHGPAGASPFLQAGVLHSHWHEQPPLHTPYSPPFLYDLMSSVMTPAGTSRLYWADIPPAATALPATKPARLISLTPAALAGDLYPLLAAAFQDGPMGVPSREEARRLLAYLAHFPTYGWQAVVDGTPAGFLLLQPDLSDRLRLAGGGRFPWWQAWFRWVQDRPVTHGRLLFGAVLPAYRNRGIGRQLWLAALQTGRELGWPAVSIGPVGASQAGNPFLIARGAKPRQQYTIFNRTARTGGEMWW